MHLGPFLTGKRNFFGLPRVEFDRLVTDIGAVAQLSNEIKGLLSSLPGASLGDKIEIENQLRIKFKALVDLSVDGLGISVDLAKISVAAERYRSASQLGMSPRGGGNQQGMMR